MKCSSEKSSRKDAKTQRSGQSRLCVFAPLREIIVRVYLGFAIVVALSSVALAKDEHLVEFIHPQGGQVGTTVEVMVEPTSPEETVQILENIKEKYEEHHHVIYTDEAIKACGAERVFVTHGYTAIVRRWLEEQGLDAQVVKTEFEGELNEINEATENTDS